MKNSLDHQGSQAAVSRPVIGQKLQIKYTTPSLLKPERHKSGEDFNLKPCNIPSSAVEENKD